MDHVANLTCTVLLHPLYNADFLLSEFHVFDERWTIQDIFLNNDIVLSTVKSVVGVPMLVQILTDTGKNAQPIVATGQK